MKMFNPQGAQGSDSSEESDASSELSAETMKKVNSVIADMMSEIDTM